MQASERVGFLPKGFSCEDTVAMSQEELFNLGKNNFDKFRGEKNLTPYQR